MKIQTESSAKMALLDGKRIFYIEDNAFNLAVVKTLLENHRAVVAFERWSGENILTKLEKFSPIDLLLLDLALPQGQSGYDIFRQVREHPGLKTVPVVIVSAADPAIEMPKAREIGVNGYIAKPVNVATLAQHLSDFFKGNQLWIMD